MTPISDVDLAHFMDEALGPTDMARIESALRESPALRSRIEGLRQARDRGWHSVGAIWRGHRLSCPTRSQLGSYLLDALDATWKDYINFHIDMIGCHICQANLEDLRAKQEEQAPSVVERRRRVYHSSVGHLRHRS